MKREIYEVKRKTKSEIRQYANYVREKLGVQVCCIDIIKILEDIFPKFIPGYSFRVVNDEDKDVDMNGVLAYTEISNEAINMYVREEVYDSALRDNGFARFTLAHEAGHVLMHYRENIILARNTSFSSLRTPIEKEKDPEWQADQFAAELLAPLHLTKGMTVNQIRDVFKVSYTCACNRKKPK